MGLTTSPGSQQNSFFIFSLFMMRNRRLGLGTSIALAVAVWIQYFSSWDPSGCRFTIIDPCPSFDIERVYLPYPPDEKDPLLMEVEHILHGFVAPEDGFRLDGVGENWIWSMGNGDLLKVDLETMTALTFAHTGEAHEDCGDLDMENTCGRPLGLLKLPLEDHGRYLQYLEGTSREETESPLFLVADAYKGLLLVSSKGRTIPLLTSVDGKPLYFANAMARARNGSIYLSDSSSRYRRNQVLLENLESRSTGRIVMWNPDTGLSNVVTNNLPFPNGLVLRDDDTSLLVSLTTRHQIVEIDLTKDKEDRSPTVFATLPGIPDNMHVSYSHEWKRPVLWVGTSTKSSPIIRFLNRHPGLRKVLAMIPRDKLIKCFKKYGLVLALDPFTGKLLRAYQDPTGTTAYIAGVHFDDSYAYLGSWRNPFLARIPREKLFAVDFDSLGEGED